MTRGSAPGTLGASYAAAREASTALRFRYLTRARLAWEQLLRHRPFKGFYQVLDLGAADGRALVELRRLLGGRGKFVGVELSAELLAAAPPMPPDTELLEGDAAALPANLADGTFDLVSALAVLEHLPDPEAVVAAAFAKLAPGGVFVATTPHGGWDRVAGMLGLVDTDAHDPSFRVADLAPMLRSAGFERVEALPFMFAPVATLGYALPIPAGLGLRVDAALRRLRAPSLAYVNHAVVGVKPV